MTQPQPSTISCPLTPTSIDMSARAATATATTLPNLLTRIFTSLSHNNRRWSLRRTLQSDNPLDINGELRGTATFTPLRARNDTETKPNPLEMVYREEGELPNTSTFGSGLRWTKKYIWQQQQGSQGHISVWFVKVKPHVARRIPVTDSNSNTTTEQETTEEEDEADYLFHEFDFGVEGGEEGEAFVVPPEPPAVATEGKGDGEGEGKEETDVVVARGNHLCINDMYRTAYAFRIRRKSGEVVSWSSRHVVKGPKKNQDIVNLYRMEE